MPAGDARPLRAAALRFDELELRGLLIILAWRHTRST
jgi:hypothetical protein